MPGVGSHRGRGCGLSPLAAVIALRSPMDVSCWPACLIQGGAGQNNYVLRFCGCSYWAKTFAVGSKRRHHNSVSDSCILNLWSSDLLLSSGLANSYNPIPSHITTPCVEWDYKRPFF